MNNSFPGSNIVLAVDDSAETLGMLNKALEKANMTTLVALEGLQAISIAQKMKPDIILMDAIMPNMDGFETCRRLKQDNQLKHIPVIFMTGLTEIEDVVKGFEAGGVDYLTKPINPVELVARMNVHLMNAKVTFSAQQALDSTGQILCGINESGEKVWATPQAELFFSSLEEKALAGDFFSMIKEWLSHDLKEGNKSRFENDGISTSCIYLGRSFNNEYLIRFLDDQEFNEQKYLQDFFSITKRESEVFLWLAKGKTNREIALILDMSPRTVNKHLEQLFRKLEVDNRTSAAAMAIQSLQKRLI